MSDFDGVFEGIVAANPDLNGGPPVMNLRMGDMVASVPLDEFEQLWHAVGESLLGDGVYVHAWVPVSVYPVLVQIAVGYSAYKWAVLGAFDLGVEGAGRVLASALNFLGFIEFLKGADHGR